MSIFLVTLLILNPGWSQHWNWNLKFQIIPFHYSSRSRYLCPYSYLLYCFSYTVHWISASFDVFPSIGSFIWNILCFYLVNFRSQVVPHDARKHPIFSGINHVTLSLTLKWPNTVPSSDLTVNSLYEWVHGFCSIL